MKIEFTHKFIKIFKKRFSSKSNIQNKFNERSRKFAENQNNPTLKDHELTGKLEGNRAFSVTGDIRVVYYIFENTAYCIYSEFPSKLSS